MNHLAHFLLCPADDEMRAGTLIADYARGNDLSMYPPMVELGIRLHRRIDALVDTSPQVSALKPLVDAPLRRYAGILFDVFFDYALIRGWPSPGNGEARSEFSAGVYTSLAHTETLMPAAARTASTRMRTYDALSSCATHESCARTLARIATRLKRPVELAAGIETLVRHEARIVETFTHVLADLRNGAQAYLSGASLTHLIGASHGHLTGSSLNTRPLELSVSR